MTPVVLAWATGSTMLPFPEMRCFEQCTLTNMAKKASKLFTYDYFDLAYSPPEMTSLDGNKAQDSGGELWLYIWSH